MTAPSLLPLRRSFLDRLAAGRALAYPLFRGLHPWTSLSGPPTEFEGHRPYLPGDDTRWIDWNLFARLEELYVKVFQVEEEVEVLILVDGSLSMTVSGGRKYQTAAAAAAALFYLAMHTAHPAVVMRYAERVLDSRGPFRHIEGYSAVCDLLVAPSGGVGTDLRQALMPLVLHRRRPLTILALSDGFQRDPIEGVASTLSGIPDCRFVFLRIVDPSDLRPRLRGRISLDDIEGDGGLELIADGALEKQMHRTIGAYIERLEKGLRQKGAECLSLATGDGFEGSFLEMLVSVAPAEAGAPGP